MLMLPRVLLLSFLLASPVALHGKDIQKEAPVVPAPKVPSKQPEAEKAATKTPTKAVELKKIPAENKVSKSQEKDLCRFILFGTDRMQFVDEKDQVVNTITAPSACKTFVFDFKYKGELSSRVMGHNLIFTEASDKDVVAKEALTRGKKHNYLPSLGPKVIAASQKTLGGAKADFHEEEITVDMSLVDSEKDYVFFCSFPGHSLIMKGSFKKEKIEKKKIEEAVKTKEPTKLVLKSEPPAKKQKTH